MIEHLSDAEIEAFVVGALEPTRLAAFETHAASCDACAERLACEARRELGHVEVAAALRVGATAQKRVPRRALVVVLVSLAAAAAIALGVRLRSHAALNGAEIPTAPAVPAFDGIPPVICPDGPDQRACVIKAHRHGLLVQYPTGAGAPSFDVAGN